MEIQDLTRWFIKPVNPEYPCLSFQSHRIVAVWFSWENFLCPISNDRRHDRRRRRSRHGFLSDELR